MQLLLIHHVHLTDLPKKNTPIKARAERYHAEGLD
jgi:hypothetical protein